MRRVTDRVMNLAQYLSRAARRYPSRAAMVWGDREWTWSEFDKRVNAIVSLMAARGVAKGDRVLMQARNCNQLVETMFACFRMGAIWVPTNYRQTPHEVAVAARSSGASMMICEDIFPDHVKACAIADTVLIGGNGTGDYESLVSRYLNSPAGEVAVEYDDPCWFFHTSGSTGRPKAAVLTHGQMTFVVLNHLCDLMPGLSEDDTSLVVAPLTHGAGVHFLCQVARAAKTILPAATTLDPTLVWALVEKWRVNNMFTVPTILKRLVEHPAVAQHDHQSLRHIVYAGAPMYREDQKRALAVLGPVLVQYFGLGEVTGAVTVLRPQDHQMEDDAVLKLGTCGRERTGMQISIQDDSGTVLQPGETGEICVCGPAVFAGYHDNPEADESAFRDGWFRTGDLGRLDSEGDLFITGRSSDMYISGGSNVHPREIEERILQHPAIHQVAIVGMPDPAWGEVGVAICVLRDNQELTGAELIDWLRSYAASYKLPRDVLFWEKLPTNGYGKVTKRELRAALVERQRLKLDGTHIKEHEAPVAADD